MITYNKIIDTKPSIILDVDETLIKTKIYTLDDSKDSIIKFNKTNTLYLTDYIINNYIYIIIARPFLKQFMITMNKYFNIHIYSLGMDDYIKNILDAIMDLIGINPFCNIMANTNIKNRFLNKKLIELNIGLSNVLIIDDRSDVWKFDKHNLYKIPAYNLLTYDNELLKIVRTINIYFKQETDKTIFNIFKFRKILNEFS